MQCKGHNNKVRCIDWYADDMGFTSCGMDGNVFFYDLALQKETQTRNSERDFNQKGVVFTGLANTPGAIYDAIVVGNDRHIYSTSLKQSETRYNIS